MKIIKIELPKHDKPITEGEPNPYKVPAKITITEIKEGD